MHIELRDIHKRFGTIVANAGISLSVESGSIEGILGENGAGKSTLMKILSGFIQPDSGQIVIHGHDVAIRSPSDATALGIGMLHQDPLDFPPLRVVDNFLLGSSGPLFPSRKSAAAAIRDLAGRFAFSISPETYVDRLSIGERQQLEILRLLWLGTRILILDEPTTGISLPQKRLLFDTIKRLAGEGMSVLFVSHKLEDVEELCSRVHVLRRGALVGRMNAPFDPTRLVDMMFTRQVSAPERNPAQAGATALRLQHVAAEDARLLLRRISLDVRSGEVIGFAGMEGSGQSLLLSVCAGLTHPLEGRVIVGERDLTRHSHSVFKRAGVAYLPAARLEQGLIPGMSLAEHFVLAEHPHGFFVNRAVAEKLAHERIATYNIKGSPGTPVDALSGGNQQRALLSLLRNPLRLILLEQPTRGLDIESAAYVWSRMKIRCREGAAVVFVSGDLDEIIQYSDRVVVFFAGRVSPAIPVERVSVEMLGGLIGGRGWEEIEEPGR